MASTPTSPSPRAPRRRRLRRFAAWGIVLVCVLALLLLAVEVVRRSDLVKRLVVGKVQEVTGFIVSAADVRVGWGGATVVEDLVFTLPLSDEPALTMDRLVVRHEALPLVIIRRGLTVESVSIEHPVVLAKEQSGPEGATVGWSLAESLDRLLASLPEGEGSDGPAQIPEVTITGGELVLAPLGGARVPLGFAASVRRPSALAMTFEIEIADLLAARGEAAVGGEWTHDATARLAPTDLVWAQLRRMLRAEMVETPAAEARWIGRLGAGGLAGLLHIERASSGEITAAGDTGVLAGDTVALSPRGLRLEIGGNPPVVVHDGRVLVDREQVVLEDVVVEGADQVLNIDARADTQALAGQAEFAFRGRAGELFTHQGSGSLEVQSPAGRPVVVATLAGSGESPNGRVRTEARLTAAGSDWRNLAGTLELARLEYRSGDTTWDASGLAIAAGVTETGVVIDGVDIPNARSSLLSGQVSFEDLAWSLNARINDWRPLAEGPEFDLVMQSEGVGGAVESFFAEGGDEALRFTGRGAYDPTLPKPVSLGVELAIDREAGPDGTEAAPAAGASVIPASLYGAISADFTLSGTLQPVRLDGEARMLTEGVRFREVVFEDMELLGTAEFHEGGGTFSSEEFALLEGNASLVARSDWRGNVQAEARVEGVNLETLGVIFAPEVPLKGRAGAVLTAELPGGELEDVVARAEWRVEGFATTLFEVERAVGAATYAEGVVELEETSIFNGGGEVRTRATFPLDNLSNVDASVEADRFAMQLGGVRAVVTGRSEGTLDVLNQRAEMSLAGSADFTLEEQRVATIGIDGQITGRTLELGTIEGRIGDGVLGGVAIVPLDALAESTARLTLRDLEPRYFGGLWAQTRDVAGRVNGTLVLAPTSEEHAPEPSRLDVEFALSDAAWRSVALESLSIQAYIGEERSVLHRAIARLGGGTVTLWGSTNDHDGDRYVQLSGDVRSVDLQQVVSAVAPDADRYEGRVSATFSGAGYALEPHRLFGQATVTVTDSDLIAIPVINELYSLFRASDRGDRNGAGIAEMRLDGERLYIPRADYFNRGLELRASLTVADVFRGKHSPIVGMAVGTARPLAGSELGLTERADRMLSAAQAGGTIARIDGTLSEPEAKVVALADLQNFVSRLLSPLGE